MHVAVKRRKYFFSRGSVGVLIHAFESWWVMITLTWNLCLREKKGKKSYSFTTPSILGVCLVYSVQLCNLPSKISTKFQVHFLLLNLHICGSDLHNTLLPFRQHISMPANVLSFLWRILQHSFLFINPGPGCRDSSQCSYSELLWVTSHHAMPPCAVKWFQPFSLEILSFRLGPKANDQRAEEAEAPSSPHTSVILHLCVMEK